MKKIAAIVQARMGSARLPGKILKDLCGKPVLWHVYNRLKQAELLNKIIIATTVFEEDNSVEDFCIKNEILFNRGSSENVLSRFYETAKKFKVEIIVRITADCPVIDPGIVDDMIKAYISAYEVKDKTDYLSNSLTRTFPRGLDAEIFSFQALEKAYLEADKEYEKEHVTPYIYQHPHLFKIREYINEKDYSYHRWTIDTKEDYILIKEIYKNLYGNNPIFSWKEILDLFKSTPELLNINKEIKQKEI